MSGPAGQVCAAAPPELNTIKAIMRYRMAKLLSMDGGLVKGAAILGVQVFVSDRDTDAIPNPLAHRFCSTGLYGGMPRG